jgi:hypothetical protein
MFSRKCTVWILSRHESQAEHEYKGGIFGKSEQTAYSCQHSLFIDSSSRVVIVDTPKKMAIIICFNFLPCPLKISLHRQHDSVVRPLRWSTTVARRRNNFAVPGCWCSRYSLGTVLRSYGSMHSCLLFSSMHPLSISQSA